MAAIDKIYGSTEQYDEFYEWCKKHKPEAINYFYPRSGYENDSDRPITNLPESIDMWLLENCDITYITEFIKDQYGMK